MKVLQKRLTLRPDPALSSKGSDVFVAVHIGFMWMLLLVAYGQRDPNAYFLQKHIRESFSKNVSDSMSLGDVFSWSSTVLLKNLFGEYSGERCTLCQLFIFKYPALHGDIKSCCHSTLVVFFIYLDASKIRSVSKVVLFFILTVPVIFLKSEFPRAKV